VLKDLQSLRNVQAPETLVERVLRTVGLVDAYAEVESEIGAVFVARSAKGITLVRRAQGGPRFERDYNDRFGRRLERRQDLAEEFNAALHAGTKAVVDLRGVSDFAREVLRTTRKIQRGYVRPYSWVANVLGRAKAVRAVGTALASNPVPLIIPCHRVVRADTTAGEYLFGADEKERLLICEGVDCSGMRELTERHVRFVGSLQNGTFCHLYCWPARRSLPKHLVELSSAQEARVVPTSRQPERAFQPSTGRPRDVPRLSCVPREAIKRSGGRPK
jgi:methylated-DNA-[protein]-cysteine S-methyltransferase